MLLPKPFTTCTAAGSLSRNGWPGCGRIAVTPVCTAPSERVTWPTVTPATSVIELEAPGGRLPMVTPRSRRRGDAVMIPSPNWSRACLAGGGRRRHEPLRSAAAPHHGRTRMTARFAADALIACAEALFAAAGLDTDTAAVVASLLVEADLMGDRKSVVEGTRVSDRVDPGGRRLFQKKNI